MTVSAKERWGNEVAYLISRPDPYDAPPKRGHGVGLSQIGAKARAAAGQGYEDILAFYYPGCKMEVEKEMTDVIIKCPSLEEAILLKELLNNSEVIKNDRL